MVPVGSDGHYEIRDVPLEKYSVVVVEAERKKM